MEFELSPEQTAWRDEVRSFLATHFRPSRRNAEDSASLSALRSFHQQMIRRGWYGVNLPAEFGGLGRSAVDRLILVEQFERVGAPHLDMTITSLAPIIVRHGTAANRETWLPRIMRGEVVMALGYSEPDSGSDLASLRTAAVRDGDSWVINGQKTWNSRADIATHEWLAVRTDPVAPQHAGISILIVPIQTPGIDVRPLYTWGYDRTNVTYFDNVRIPAGNLIGELNSGWRYITDALDFERVALGSVGGLLRLYDKILEFCMRSDSAGVRLADRAEVSLRLARLDVDLTTARLFGYRSASLIDSGAALSVEASIQKLFVSELRTRLAETTLEILGPLGRLTVDDPEAPLGGLAEEAYRVAPLYRFGGGTNEIMRDIVARRGLGMPRTI